MLALLRSTRGAKEVSRHVRTLSTIAPSATFLDVGAAEQRNDLRSRLVRERQSQLASSSAECMFVFPWNGIRSSAEGLAIAHAVQEKYGPAKEVIFPRVRYVSRAQAATLSLNRRTPLSQDTDSITVFHSYFWLIFDHADVRKRLPEESAQIRVRVADLPRGDGNVGIEEMVRALGLSTDKEGSLKPQPPAEGKDEGSAAANDAADGYRDLDVRVEWASTSVLRLSHARAALAPLTFVFFLSLHAAFGPNEVLQPRRMLPIPDKRIPKFAAAWLAFDGFSPEAARGAHTPNLFRAREKWRALAPATATLSNDPSAAGTPSLVGEVGAEPAPVPEEELELEPEVGADMNVASRQWVPIFSHSPSSTLRPPTVPKSDVDIHNTTDDFAPITAAAAAVAPSAAAVAPAPTPAPAPSSSLESAMTEIPVGTKMSRRERILHLARQNAQTPLPELAERPQPVPEAEKSTGESEQEGKERTIRERLWRLVGGNY